MITEEQVFYLGRDLKNQGIDKTEAEKRLYDACGIKWHTMSSPASCNPEDDIFYEFFCPEIDAPIEMSDAFWNGYYNC